MTITALPASRPEITSTCGASSRGAAAVAAAHGVLVGFYPAQAATLDATYATYLADNGLTGNEGLAVGEAVVPEKSAVGERIEGGPLVAVGQARVHARAVDERFGRGAGDLCHEILLVLAEHVGMQVRVVDAQPAVQGFADILVVYAVRRAAFAA